MNYSHEQAIHDEVNLLRLVRRLEKLAATEADWDEAASDQQERVWLQALGTLQKVKHGRKLLQSIEQYDTDPTPKKTRQRSDFRTKLDRIEVFVTEVKKRTEPVAPKPEPVLPTIPVPLLAVPDTEPEARAEVEPPSTTTNDSLQDPILLREEVKDRSSEALHLDDHTPLSSPPNAISPVSSLLPATPTVTHLPYSAPSTLTSTAIEPSSSTLNSRKRLQASTALQEELSAQLAQMATQLKRNALHFSDSLVKDKAVVEETQEKLEGNFGMMMKERLRLRDFRGKSRSTTCLVLGIVIAVLALFMFMVSVIRFSRR